MQTEGGERIAITRFDPRQLHEGQLSEYHEFSGALQCESNPEDPPVPLEVFAGWELWAPTSVDLWGWSGRTPGSKLVAVCYQPTARLQAVFRAYQLAGRTGPLDLALVGRRPTG